MQLRRFTADSTPAALGAVRQALGDDAIILANRKIGDQVEIIATGQMGDAQALADMSLDDTTSQLSSRLDADTVSLSADSSIESSERSFDELTAAIDAVETKTEPLMFGFMSDKPKTQSRNSNAVQNEGSLSPNIPLHETTSGSRRGTNANTRIGKGTLHSDSRIHTKDLDGPFARHSEQLLRIVEAQSNLINSHFKALEVNLWGNNSPNRSLHLQRLFAMGIGAELAVQLAGRIHAEASIDDALRQSFALLKSTLPIGVDKTFTVPGVTIFSGLPGAGKTTALMKIATQHVKEYGSDSIVVICADTRRIGAFEELQAYGRLLGVPTVHAHDSAELDSLLAAFTHKQLILIDHTLPQDNDAVEIPRRLLRPDVADSVRQLLVLSATAQSSTTEALISSQCEGRAMQCVLTHLDASARLGEMFNAIIRHHLPIAYWSDTASIQKPLQKAEASVLIATAAAMSRRLPVSPDDEWLLRLIQPSDDLVSPPMHVRNKTEAVV